MWETKLCEIKILIIIETLILKLSNLLMVHKTDTFPKEINNSLITENNILLKVK